MVVRAAPLMAVLMLCACGRGGAHAPAQKPPPPPDSQPSPTTVRPGASLPPADAAARYVGLWAADVKACADPPWRFEPRRLTTKGEVSCAFDEVHRAPGGYDIAATCTAEAPPKAYTLKLRFAESAKAMLVDGGPFAEPVGLVWCGPPRP
jgi:hypothetical protein